MSPQRPSICFVAPGHLSSTPRVVKHATALAAAGYEVHVVTGRHFPPAESLDATILAGAKWRSVRVPLHGWRRWSLRASRQFARYRFRRDPSDWTAAASAQHSGHTALARAAAHTGATFYYGHGGVAGLAAAARAAHLTGACYGFDAEDWHEEENISAKGRGDDTSALRCLLEKLLPNAALLTCAAPLIGDAYAARYQVSPTCILNVFPLAEAPPAPPTSDTAAESPVVFYWFSQTIGPGRGLEEIIGVMGRMKTSAVLHVRGFVAADYRDVLVGKARISRTCIEFYPPAPPSEMARLASGAQLGLSLEKSIPRNRDLCLTNKIFTYLLAGVPVALTPTSAQRELQPKLGAAAFALDLEAPEAAAERLDRWLAEDFATAAKHAWELGRNRFNWDHEQRKLLDLFRERVGSPR